MINIEDKSKKNEFLQAIDAYDIMREHKTMERINLTDEQELTVCGDIHGQYYDLLNIWDMNGYPSEEKPYLFNGDFVDRGSFSVEVILALLVWKVRYPNSMFLVRGKGRLHMNDFQLFC
jgi:serine/threonine-protein phosphatase 5